MTTKIESPAIKRELLRRLNLPQLDHLLEEVGCEAVRLDATTKYNLMLTYAYDETLRTPIYVGDKHIGDTYITSTDLKNGHRTEWFSDTVRSGVWGTGPNLEPEYDEVIVCETLRLMIRVKLLLRSVTTNHPPVVATREIVPLEVKRAKKLIYIYEGAHPMKRVLFHLRYQIRRLDKENRRMVQFAPTDDSTQLFRKLLGKERTRIPRCNQARIRALRTKRISGKQKEQAQYNLCLFSEVPKDFLIPKPVMWPDGPPSLY